MLNVYAFGTRALTLQWLQAAGYCVCTEQKAKVFDPFLVGIMGACLCKIKDYANLNDD